MGHGQSTASGTRVLAKVAQGDARAAQQVSALSTPQAAPVCTNRLLARVSTLIRAFTDVSRPCVHCRDPFFSFAYLAAMLKQVEDAKAGYFQSSKGRRAALAVAAGTF